MQAAIYRLVRPYPVATAQPDATAERGERVTVVTHPPLLQQLREAVYSGTGAHANGNTSGAERIPLDPGALAIHDNIARIIGVWYAKAQLRPVGLDTAGMLEEWARSFIEARHRGEVPDESWLRRLARLQLWASEIEALFDPPKQVPLASACPICGVSWASNRDGENVQALVVEYWMAGELIRRAAARCRNRECEFEWHGIAGIQQLMSRVLESEATCLVEQDAQLVLQLTPDDLPELSSTGPIGVLA